MKEVTLTSDRELEVLLIALTASSIKGVEQIRMAGKCLDALENIANLAYDAEGSLKIYEMDGGQIRIENNRPVRASTLKSVPSVLKLDEAQFAFLKTRIFEAGEWSGTAAAVLYRLLQKFEDTQEG